MEFRDLVSDIEKLESNESIIVVTSKTGKGQATRTIQPIDNNATHFAASLATLHDHLCKEKKQKEFCYRL